MIIEQATDNDSKIIFELQKKAYKSEEALHIYSKLGYTVFKSRKLDTHTLVFLEKMKS